VIHVSTHISLRQACDLVTKERVFKAIKIAHQGAKQMGISKPRVAVAGLNPHAGEGGIFGQEEIYEIRPAIEAAIEMGIEARGPIPSDSIFFRAMKGEFDIVVAMYHDQGHIPVKMFGFKKGVNVTLGIPIIRTSVDHGTAYDIAGKGIADPQSLQEAIKLAVQIYKARKSD